MVWPTHRDKKMDEYDAYELPGQQLAASYALTPLDHILNLDYKAAPACQRLTCVMATVGKMGYNIQTLEEMIMAGMNIANVNMTYGTREQNIEIIKNIKEATKRVSVKLGRYCPVAISAKIAGTKISTGRIGEAYGDEVELKAGESVKLTSDDTYKDRCSSYTVFVDFVNFFDQLSRGQVIYLDKEKIKLKVEVVSMNTVTCKVEQGGFLGSFKDIYIPNVVLNMPTYSERDKLDLAALVQNQVDIIIAPFTHDVNSITELRGLLGQKGRKIAVIAKIQSMSGYFNLSKILNAANAIMLSRQELGSDITPNKLIIVQKNIIARANLANVPVIVSAQILSTLQIHKNPLRAEVLDLANCILDGADAIALSIETAIGEYPVHTIETLVDVCKEAESAMWTGNIFNDFLQKTPMPCDQVYGTSVAAVLAAQRTIAAVIIVITTTGKTACVVSKFRPKCPIIAVTRYPNIARQLHMWRGVMPVVYEELPNVDWQADLENRVNFGSKWGLENGFIRIGDPIVIVSGWRQGSGYTNTMRIVYAAAETIMF